MPKLPSSVLDSSRDCRRSSVIFLFYSLPCSLRHCASTSMMIPSTRWQLQLIEVFPHRIDRDDPLLTRLNSRRLGSSLCLPTSHVTKILGSDDIRHKVLTMPTWGDYSQHVSFQELWWLLAALTVVLSQTTFPPADRIRAPKKALDNLGGADGKHTKPIRSQNMEDFGLYVGRSGVSAASVLCWWMARATAGCLMSLHACYIHVSPNWILMSAY